MFKKLMIFIIISFSQNALSSEEIDHSCLVSFDLDKNKSIKVENQSVSCPSIDNYRAEIYKNLSHGDHEYILENIGRTKNQIELIKKMIKNSSLDEDISSLYKSSMGSTISTLGLVFCAESAGIGCLVSLVSYFSSRLSEHEATTNIAKKLKIIEDLKKELLKAEKEINSHKDRLPSDYDNLVKGFNFYCKEIRENCLN